jgi:hypothetical protein
MGGLEALDRAFRTYAKEISLVAPRAGSALCDRKAARVEEHLKSRDLRTPCTKPERRGVPAVARRAWAPMPSTSPRPIRRT